MFIQSDCGKDAHKLISSELPKGKGFITRHAVQQRGSDRRTDLAGGAVFVCAEAFLLGACSEA